MSSTTAANPNSILLFIRTHIRKPGPPYRILEIDEIQRVISQHTGEITGPTITLLTKTSKNPRLLWIHKLLNERYPYTCMLP